MTELLKFNYDYSKCMVMKLGMAHPDKNNPGKSRVLLTFADALEYIKKIDNITQGITKIYYIVGWQYLGHDDKYPDFFEVNEALKRSEDETAYDSFKWLCREAGKHHSIISVHINFNDAYDNAPSFSEFVKANALIRGKNGKPRAIEKYNGRKCYKTCLKTYWESGLFKKMFDRFADTFPFIIDAGTIHVDNFQCYKNYAPRVSIKEMQQARREMIKYAHKKGVDITSEFTYKENEHLPNKPIFGLPREHSRKEPLAALGLIPMSWWCSRLTKAELLSIPPQIHCGGEYGEKAYNRLLYGNMHGEDIVRKDNPRWAQEFIRRFATYQVPGHFLYAHKRLEITGAGRNMRCAFDGGIASFAKGERITRNGKIIKDGSTLFLPLMHKERQYIAYSEKGDRRSWDIPETTARSARIYKITENGNEFINEAPVLNGALKLDIPPQTALLVTL